MLKRGKPLKRSYIKRRKKPKKRRKKTARKKLLDKLWKVCSLYIRLRDIKKYGGGCPLCNNNPIQVAFHFLPRGIKIIKYDPINLVGACKNCNFHEMKTRGADFRYEKWFIANRGQEEWDRLNKLKYTIVQYSLDDIEKMIKKFEGLIE